MDHPAVIFRFISDWERWQGMAFREVLVTQVREVLRAWLAGAGKRPAARRAGVDVKTAARYIRAAQAARTAAEPYTYSAQVDGLERIYRLLKA